MPLTRTRMPLTTRKNAWLLTLKREWWLLSRITSVIYRHVCAKLVFRKLMEFVMTWECLVLSWISVSVVFLIKRMRHWTCGWIRMLVWQPMKWWITMTIMTWFVFSSSMARINSLNRLPARLNKLGKSSQSRLRLNWQKLSSRPNLPRNSRRRAILLSRFSRLFGLKSMMNWERQMSPSSRLWRCWLWMVEFQWLPFIP